MTVTISSVTHFALFVAFKNAYFDRLSNNGDERLKH